MMRGGITTVAEATGMSRLSMKGGILHGNGAEAHVERRKSDVRGVTQSGPMKRVAPFAAQEEIAGRCR